MNNQNFILTNGFKYITKNKGKYVEIANKSKATKFTYNKAYSVLNANLAKRLKKSYTIEELNESDLNNKDNMLENISLHEFDVSSLSDELQYWYNRISELDSLKKDAKKRKEELSILHIDVEEKKEDLEHKLEFSEKLSACDGYKLAKKLKDVLKERRKIKDELLIIGVILRSNVDFDGNKIIKSIEGLTTREYRPRILPELFIA